MQKEAAPVAHGQAFVAIMQLSIVHVMVGSHFGHVSLSIGSRESRTCSVPDTNLHVLYSVKLRLSLAFGKRYSRALRGSPAVVKEAGAVP